jgi:fructokinase
MNKLTEAIKKMAESNPEGFTVDLTTLKRLTQGYSVAYFETQNSFGDEGLSKVLNHAMKHGKKIGGWLNEENGYFYYDSIQIFTDLEAAKRFGRQNGQIAIFDLTGLRVIKL